MIKQIRNKSVLPYTPLLWRGIKGEVLFICMLFLFNHAMAQTAAQQLSAVSEKYLHADTLHMEVEVKVYKNSNDQQGVMMGVGMMSKLKKNYYSKFLTDEMISNSTCTMLINHEDKTIIYFEGNTASVPSNSYSIPKIDSLLTKIDSVTFNGIKNGNKLFAIYNKHSPIIETDLYINPSTLFLEKIVYYYTPSDEETDYGYYKAEINYKNVTTKNVDQSLFSEKKCIVLNGDKIQLTAAYKNYKLTIEKNEKL